MFKPIVFNNEKIISELRLASRSQSLLAKTIDQYYDENKEFKEAFPNIKSLTEILSGVISTHKVASNIADVVKYNQLQNLHFVADIANISISKNTFTEFDQKKNSSNFWTIIENGKFKQVSEYLDFIKDPFTKNDLFKKIELYRNGEFSEQGTAVSALAQHGSIIDAFNIAKRDNSQITKTEWLDKSATPINSSSNLIMGKSLLYVAFAHSQKDVIDYIKASNYRINATDIAQDFSEKGKVDKNMFKHILTSSIFISSSSDMKNLWKSINQDIKNDKDTRSTYMSALHKSLIKERNHGNENFMTTRMKRAFAR